jgi:hypothetical protein
MLGEGKEHMIKRPTSVTVIAWIVIISALFAAFGVFRIDSNPVAAKLLAQSPLPASVHMAFGIFGAVVCLIAGYGMLKGYPWSRWLYVGWGLIGLLFSYFTVPIMSVLVMSLVFLGIIAFFLFRPVANAWFQHTPIADS